MIEIIPKSKIFNLIFKFNNKYKINILCIIFWVSISWYYKHRKLILTNQIKENREKDDVNKIKNIVIKYHKKCWYRVITMKLFEKWIIMNHKKTLRLMKKYDLLSIIRKKNPYKHIMKATQEHRTCNNILDRKFRWLDVLKKLWTDISYLYYNWTKAYISILKDMVTWEVISHKVSSNLWLWFVINTIKQAKYNFNLKWSIIHSDQWFHYTNPIYISLLKKNWIIQSMSRKWNCLDNAPTESFFWHFKDEIDLSYIKSLKELEKYINNYIFYYNNSRTQWNRKKMTPVQYRNHLNNL